jgi:glycosyltransferase involved in cell wall biosynthesis
MMLHVACLPFPSYQGTQAALAAMLDASARAGRETHVLTYAHGAYPLEVPYRVHRIPDFPRVHSLRSGPSVGKLLLDARFVAAIRRLVDTLEPEAVVAHHVEAAFAARLAGVGRALYVAHTSLETELSVYFPRLPESPLRSIGRTVDRIATGGSIATAAVAPTLAERLGEGVIYLPVPWRDRRAAPETKSSGAVMLYAGNLDAYQGWEDLLEAIRILRSTRPDARLLIASESDPAPARRQAALHGVLESVDFCRLDGEAARSRAHRAADLAWIPRRTEGGLPIKMLEAFARGVPVVTTERATAGLPVNVACKVIPNDDPRAFAEATHWLLGDAPARQALTAAGHRYLATHHGDEAYLTALDRLLGRDATRDAATPNAPRQKAVPELQAR